MLKYCFNVYNRETGEKMTQLITNVDCMLETLNELNKLGMVKGYILDSDRLDLVDEKEKELRK